MKTKQDFGKERRACCKFYELILMKLLKAAQNVDECRHETDKLINYAKEVKIMPTGVMILRDM